MTGVFHDGGGGTYLRTVGGYVIKCHILFFWKVSVFRKLVFSAVWICPSVKFTLITIW